jgi:LytS/YehU family sensor histidine kinase
MIEYLIELLLIDNLYSNNLTNQGFLVGAKITVFVWLLFRLGIAIGTRGLVEYTNERERRKQLEIFNFQSELSLFRAQVNPHFLFNTLNNIDALIHTNPDKASETLIQLSKQMRYLLYDSNVEKIDLTEEIHFVENYIDLERIRIKNKNFVNLKVIGNPQGIRIAPMLFIAFVENAFKHGSNKQDDKGLTIRFSITKDSLLFECKNVYEKVLEIEGIKYSGVGLELVKKRLDLIYKSNYELRITQENNCYAVQLSFPLESLN